MQAPNGPSKRVHTGKPLSKRILENWQMYLFLLIPMVWLIVFKYWPMYGVTIAFKKYAPKAGILGSPWVGFEYLVRFFQSYQFNRTVFNTVSVDDVDDHHLPHPDHLRAAFELRAQHQI